MVDDTNLNEATESLDDVARNVELLKKASSDLGVTTKNYIDSARQMADAFVGAPESAKKYQKGLESVENSVGRIIKKQEEMGDSAESENNKSVNSVKKLTGAMVEMGHKVAQALGMSSDAAKSLVKNIVTGLDAAGGLFAIKGIKKFTDEFEAASNLISEGQKPLLETKKLAMQVGMGFGQSFAEASSGMTDFHNAIAESITNTRSMGEEVGKVQNSLKAAFDTKEMTKNLQNLESANKGFE
ncbi:hypothetical protein LCGC14_1827690, partial [marine sediment metagenome]